MTRLLNAAQTKTIELLRYNNMVRRFLLPIDHPILDYTRAHADDIFHEMWASNSVSAPKDYSYRVFREWSLVERGREEFAITANEIEGLLKWAREQVRKHSVDMNHERADHMKSYRAYLLISAVTRCQRWEQDLRNLSRHIESYNFEINEPAEDEIREAVI